MTTPTDIANRALQVIGTRLYGDPMGQTTSAGQITYGGTAVAAASCGSLAGSAGCVKMNIGGTARYVPYY